MKKIAILAACALVASCTLTEQPEGKSSGRQIVFHASMGQYSVKATDTSFENGDEVLIIAATPINAKAKYSFNGGALSSETPICWADGQKDQSEFYLYYPYRDDLNYGDASAIMSVNADQSTHALYTASDIMAGYAKGSPSDKSVDFEVSHKMSKIRIFINNTTDKTIQDVFFSGVYGKCTADDYGIFSATGSKGTIKACPVTIDSTKAWTLIVVPQTSQPELMVTMTDQTQYTYTLPQEFTFKSGYQTTARVTLSENSVFTNFTTEISDWTPDNDLQFGQDDPSAGWNYLGVGHYMDDVMASVFSGVGNYEMECDVYEDANTPGRYKFVNPYRQWKHASVFDTCDGIIILKTDSSTGLSYVESGSTIGLKYNNIPIEIESYCPENGYSEEYYFRNENAGCYRGMCLVTKISGQAYWAAINDMAIFTLPGYVRKPVFTDVLAEYGGPVEYEGGKYASLTATPAIDLNAIRAAVFEKDVWNAQKCLDSTLALTAKNIAYSVEDNCSNESVEIYYPLAKQGIYYFMVAGEGNYNGEYVCGYWWQRFAYTPVGEEVPACEPVLSNAAPNESSPGSSVVVYVTCKDFNYAQIAAIKSSIASQMPEDTLYAYVEANGDYVRGTSSAFAEEGQKVQIDNLEPETEYTIVLRAENLYESVGYAKATVKTGSAMTFTELGTGKYYDFIFAIQGWVASTGFEKYYVSDVLIEQESTGKPIYRVHNPYKKFWENATDKSRYTGNDSEIIEFYTKEYSSGTYVFYQPYYNGYIDYIDDENGYPILYKHYSGDIYDQPEKYAFTYQNKMLSEGVFQLAPAGILYGSVYLYQFYTASEAIIITLPGYTYTPSVDQEESGDTKAVMGKSKALKPEKQKSAIEGVEGRNFVKATAPVTVPKAQKPDFNTINPDVKTVCR